MSRELLKQALDALNEIEYEDNNGEKYAWELIQSLESELAKPDEPVGYIMEYEPGKYYSDFTVNPFAAQTKSEDLGAKPVKVYLDHQLRQQEPDAIIKSVSVDEYCLVTLEAKRYMFDYFIPGKGVYLNPPRQQEPLSKPYPLSFYHGSTGDYINGFEDGVAWAEDQHGIGGGE